MYEINNILINNKKIFYYDFGKNNDIVIIMVSGFGTPYPLLDMYNLAKDLSKYFRCIIIDRPGYGESEIVNTRRDSSSFSNEIIELLIRLNVKSSNVIMLGHSLGAVYSLILSQRLKLKGIILLDFENLNMFQLIFTKFMYGIYYGICKTSLKEKYNNKMIQVMVENIDAPSSIKNKAKDYIKNNMPNICIKNEVEGIKKDLHIVKHSLIKRNLRGLFICTKKNEKANFKIQKYFKEYKTVVLDSKNHFVHYDSKEKIINEILDFFEVKK